MDRVVNERGRYAFGQFRLDVARQLVTRDGAEVVMTPTVFDTLLYLVENPARVVTKEELLAAVWPGRFVEEFNLTQTISVLRKVLRDSGDDNPPIATVQRRGYRFTADVRPVADMPSPYVLPVAPEPLPAVLALGSRSADPDMAYVPEGLSREFPQTSPETVSAPRADEAGVRPPARVDRRGALIGGAALAVAAVGAGSWVWWRGYGRSAPSDKSIVVLPFANLSGDPNQEYFSDGITEELRTALTTIPGFRVIGRVSSAQVRDMSSQDIGAKLGVSAILTGSVRRSPTAIRVSAQLIDSARGVERWSEDYDRAPGDVLAIEDGIAKGVASALEVRLGANEAFVGTSDPQARDLYLQALTLGWEASDDATSRQAIKLIDAAVQIDPRYAKAHVARAEYLLALSNNATHLQDQFHLQSEAEQSARRGVALAPGWSQAYDQLGSALRAQLDYRGALDQFLRAQRLDPNHISASLPLYLADIGRGAAAVTAQEAVISRDPLNPRTWCDQAYILCLVRRYEESLALARQTLAWAPKLIFLKVVSAAALCFLGRSRELLDEISALPDDDVQRMVFTAIATWRLGDRRASDVALARLKGQWGDTSNYQIAEVFALRGEVDAALASLEEAWRHRDTGLVGLRTDPAVDPLRHTPQFNAMLAKLNFP